MRSIMVVVAIATAIAVVTAFSQRSHVVVLYQEHFQHSFLVIDLITNGLFHRFNMLDVHVVIIILFIVSSSQFVEAFI